MSQIIESTITTSITTSLEPKPDVPKKTDQSETISELFRTKSPNEILPELHQLGFTCINECHCCSEFSRTKDVPTGNPDVREIIETELPKTAAEKFKTEEPLTILTIGPGQGFSDLVELSKFREKGFTNITWILVDPLYSKGEEASSFSKELGQKTLEQIKQIAVSISPGIKIHVLESVEEIAESPLASTTDVFIDFDDNMLGQKTSEGYAALLQPVEKFMHSLSKPVIYLHSDQGITGFRFNKQTQSILRDIETVVTMSYISPNKEEPDQRILTDSTIPQNYVFSETDDNHPFKYFIMSDDYDAVKYCLERGANPNLMDQAGFTFLMTSAEKGRFNAMKALVEIGHVNVNETGYLGYSPLHCAACFQNPKEITDYLVQQGANVNIQDRYGMTPLHLSARMGKLQNIRALIAHNAKTDIVDIAGYNALKAFKEFQARQPGAYDEDTIKEIEALLTTKTVETTPNIQTREESTQTISTTLNVDPTNTEK
jgi:hypothetical protein